MALGAVLALGACTGSPEAGSPEAGPTTAGSGSTSQSAEPTGTAAGPGDEQAASPSPTPTREPSPLDALFSEAYGELTAGQEQTEHAKVEQIVAECMQAEGFEYIPVPASGPPALVIDDQLDPATLDPDAPRAGTLEFAKELGYGISTWDIESGQAYDVEVEQPEDPNAEYVASLSDGAREAYELALHGVPPTDAELSSDDWTPDPATSGCYGKASEEVWNAPGDAWDAPEFAGLVEEISGVASNLENDPEVTAASALWGACMEQRGFPGLEAPWEATDLIHVGLREIWVVGQAPDPEELADLRAQELAVATADFECSAESRFEEAHREAQHRAEQEFIDAHREELEALLDAIRAQRDAAVG